MYDEERMIEMKEVYEFLKAAGTYYIATADGDQPRVRPFGTVDIFEGKLYIQTGLVKLVAKQMLENPKVELSAMHDGKWIRIEALVVLDESTAAQEHMLEAYPSLRSRYQPGDGNTAVFYLENATATISSFTEPARVINF